MIDHVSIRVTDLEKSTKFYKPCLEAIGYKQLEGDFDGAVGFAVNHPEDDSGSFWLVKEDYVTKNIHVAFAVSNKEIVQKFYDSAMKAGGKDNGKPGMRPEYGKTYYGGFVLDPDGNNIEATTYVK